MFKINFAVWKDGSGWQPHNIVNRSTATLTEAVEIASKMSAICTEQVISTITDESTGDLVEEIGW